MDRKRLARNEGELWLLQPTGQDGLHVDSATLVYPLRKSLVLKKSQGPSVPKWKCTGCCRMEIAPGILDVVVAPKGFLPPSRRIDFGCLLSIAHGDFMSRELFECLGPAAMKKAFYIGRVEDKEENNVLDYVTLLPKREMLLVGRGTRSHLCPVCKHLRYPTGVTRLCVQSQVLEAPDIISGYPAGIVLRPHIAERIAEMKLKKARLSKLQLLPASEKRDPRIPLFCDGKW